jgi:hypothetical protein
MLARANAFAGDTVKILADLTAMGIVFFSIRPIYEALKSRSWNTLPVIGVPFLLGTFVLAARSGDEVNYVDFSDAYDVVVDDVSDIFEDVTGAVY